MKINAQHKLKRLFRLRTILLMVVLSVLLLPLASLYFFRFYENELVRKTELELITQSAVFASVFRELIGQNQVKRNGRYTPIVPTLDLSKQKTLPRRPDPKSKNVNKQITNESVAQVAGKKMQNILFNTQKFTLAGMRILDANGVVVAGRSELNQSLAHVKEVQSALKGHYTSVLRERISDEPPPSIASISRGTGIRVFTAFPIINNGKVYGVVYLSRTPQNILKHLFSIKEKVILLSLVLLALTGLIVLFISSRLSRPIRELIDQTQQVTRGEIETVEVLKRPGTYELAKLSNSFSEMSHTLKERSHYIQQFASHVSHEFKTPLTSMQGSLELLQEHGDEMELAQRTRFLDNLQEDTTRLKNLVNRLLEQARADSLQSTSETSYLLDSLEQLESRYADSKLNIIFDKTELDHHISIAPSALYSVLSNLFDNSLQHDSTQVKLTTKVDNKQIKIYIHDNGSGISKANQERIFTPFFTTRRDTGGTGLGLGIIQSILKASNGEIKLEDSLDEGLDEGLEKDLEDKEAGTLLVIQLRLKNTI